VSDKRCSKPGCTRRTPSGQLACRPHWFALSRDLRQTINAAFRANDTTTYRQALVDAMHEWMAVA
jgi:hypothetical protein